MAYAADSPNAIGTTVPPFGGSGGGGGNTLAGDATGPLLANTVVGLQTTPVSAVAPALNEVLTFDGNTWTPLPVASPSVTLQQAYVAGRTINVTAAVGTVQIEGTTAGDATTLLTLVRNHTTGATGRLLDGTMHAAATGDGIRVTQSTSATARAFRAIATLGNNPALTIENASGTLEYGGTQINMSSGSSWTLALSGTQKLTVNAAGVTIANSTIQIPDGSAGTCGLRLGVGSGTGLFGLGTPQRLAISGGGAQAATFDGSDNSTSGTVDGTLLTFSCSQTLTAGYSALRVQVTENTTGTGTKRLLALGTTAGGVLYAIDNTGRIQAPDGTNAAPSHSFLSDPGNGMYLSAADTVGFAVNGVLQFSIDSDSVNLVAGQYLAPSGNTPGAPQYAWTASAAMGMYRASSTTIGFSTASTLRFSISSTAVTVEPTVTLTCTLLDVNNADALGGGATATLGTIGGSGPATAAQNQWLQVLIGGVNHWIPVWV